MSLAFTLTPTSINILLDGRMRTISKTHMNFDAVVDIVRQIGKTTDPFVQCDKMDALRELIDIKSFIARVTEGRVQIGDTSVQFDGVPVHGVIVSRLVAMLRDGFDVRPMARFLDKLMQNPLESARNELYEWLEKSELPIAADGDFLAFKKVRSDYKSFYDGETDNSIGTKPWVPREACDTDRTNTCSSGLHFCSFSYLSEYMGNTGRVVICKINPADVAAIPDDYDTAKGRAWTYEIIGEVPEDEAKAAFPDSVVEDFGTYHDEGEDSDDGSADYDDSAPLDWHDEEHEDEEEDYNNEYTDADDEEEPETVIPTADADDRMPREVKHDPIRLALQGSHVGLINAFSWAETPQGFNYWHGLYNHLMIGGDLPHEAELILASWARRVGAIQDDLIVEPVAPDSGPAPSILDLAQFKRALDGWASGLFTAFSWRETNQGFDFWSEQYNGNHISDEGKAILEAWAKERGIITKPPVTFMHSGKVYYPEQLRELLKEHGQRGVSRMTGVPRSTLQDWAKRI